MWLVLTSLCLACIWQATLADRSCAEGCVCKNNTMTCVAAKFPQDLLRNITEVYMRDFNAGNLQPALFLRSASWKHLRLLDIHISEGGYIMPLQDYSFIGLKWLRHLGIHSGRNKLSLQSQVFTGLDTVQTLDLSGSYILEISSPKYWNTMVTFGKKLRRSLTKIDMSASSLEYLSPKLLWQATNLQKLNLSHNNLFYMQSHFEKHFSSLLMRSVGLNQLDLSNNELNNLPEHFFAGNIRLEYLDLSYNSMDSITFGFHNISSIKFLDMSSNRISILESSTCAKLDYLHLLDHSIHRKQVDQETRMLFRNSSFQTDNANKNITPIFNWSNFDRFMVNLASNPIKCEVDLHARLISRKERTFLLWLKTSETINLTSAYTCRRNGNDIDILTLNIEEFCDLPIYYDILITTLPVAIVVLVVAITSALYIGQKMFENKLYQKFMNRLKTNTYKKRFLVFLSHSPEDIDFVLTKIYPDLHKTLSKMTENYRNLVCIGDIDFNPGHLVTAEIVRCIEDSAVVVFVVSNTFCKKGLCQLEVNEAFIQQKPIIMIMKQNLSLSMMPRFLGTIFNRYTCATWVGSDAYGHLEPGVKTFCEAILRLASFEGENFFTRWFPFRGPKLAYFVNNNNELQTV